MNQVILKTTQTFAEMQEVLDRKDKIEHITKRNFEFLKSLELAVGSLYQGNKNLAIHKIKFSGLELEEGFEDKSIEEMKQSVNEMISFLKERISGIPNIKSIKEIESESKEKLNQTLASDNQ